MPGRVCPNAFDCRGCAQHSAWVQSHAPVEDPGAEALGIPVPLDRMYHRGHTWVQSQPDGAVLVGLDELARRLAGTPEELDLPPVGARLEVNGTAWTMRRGAASARVLSPVEGEVVETGGADKGFYLRVKPDSPGWNAAHLLRGGEARRWMTRELERLQGLAGMPAVGASLADGGVVVEDLGAGIPKSQWDAVWGGIFLEP
jgi:glycine cleavage system H lipoate-binding protein